MGGSAPQDTGATNIERLRGHLVDGTLAAELVDTCRVCAEGKRAAALKDMAEARLVEIRAELASGRQPDAQD